MGIRIPDVQVSSRTEVRGKAVVRVTRRVSGSTSGSFVVELKVAFDPAEGNYPAGSVRIDADLSDSVRCRIESTSIDQVGSFGKDTPTAVVSGRCRVSTDEHGADYRGCRFWLMLADLRPTGSRGDTRDIVSFLVHDRTGRRVAYGTGPVAKGDVLVVPSTD